jgi:hypothetical protein
LRLLDLVAQSNAAAATPPDGWAFPGAHQYADSLRTCPLRLVLADDLTRYVTQLAYAEGRRLSGCLDLIHAPAQHLWLEWLEETRQSTLRQIPACARKEYASARRSGALITATPSGRAGTMRTFWSTQNEEVLTAALLTDFDLDRVIRPPLDLAGVFCGAPFGVVMAEEPAIDGLLKHVCFHFDPAWASYYRAAGLTQADQLRLLREVLGMTAFDMPMILALFLLFAAKQGLRRQVVDLERLNQSRCRLGKRPLLEHIEVRAPIEASYESRSSSAANSGRRRGPRLHHVRGHIARRGDKVFWRLPHMRGDAGMGIVRSRTVQLSFR